MPSSSLDDEQLSMLALISHQCLLNEYCYQVSTDESVLLTEVWDTATVDAVDSQIVIALVS